ncbi:MAG: hypothetical protein Q8R00_02380 [Candidatus Nanoarchaeia archaeon]|nr:hypothetical protein [Candidatus Nanoarchaeia archaeon]
MKLNKNCKICNKGTWTEVNDILMDIESYIFIVKGERCTECGEEIINEQEGQKMINMAKKIGVWGTPLKLYRKLSRSARGTVLSIPTDIEKELKLKGNEAVAISKSGKKIIIEIE